MTSPDNQAMDDLDDLLESALEDFENPAKHRKGSIRKVVSNKATLDDKKKAEGIQEKLKKIQELPAHEREEMIKEQLMGALNQMNISSEQLQGNPPTEEELDNLFQTLGAGGDTTAAAAASGIPKQFDNLLPMMEGMMQSLMSKELLYPPMKERNKLNRTQSIRSFHCRTLLTNFLTGWLTTEQRFLIRSLSSTTNSLS